MLPFDLCSHRAAVGWGETAGSEGWGSPRMPFKAVKRERSRDVVWEVAGGDSRSKDRMGFWRVHSQGAKFLSQLNSCLPYLSQQTQASTSSKEGQQLEANTRVFTSSLLPQVWLHREKVQKGWPKAVLLLLLCSDLPQFGECFSGIRLVLPFLQLQEYTFMCVHASVHYMHRLIDF